LKLAFTYLLTTRGTPMIYYGDEIGMNGGKDPYNRADFPGGWPDDESDAFEPAGRSAEQAAVHGHVQALLRLRAELEPLRRGRWLNLAVTVDTHSFARVTPEAQVVVALNNGKQPLELTVPVGELGWTAGTLVQDRLGRRGLIRCDDSSLRVSLPPRSAAILTPSGSVARVQGAGGAASGPGKDLSAE
jgi:pullulanase/glycogen debranching enzyme